MHLPWIDQTCKTKGRKQSPCVGGRSQEIDCFRIGDEDGKMKKNAKDLLLKGEKREQSFLRNNNTEFKKNIYISDSGIFHFTRIDMPPWGITVENSRNCGDIACMSWSFKITIEGKTCCQLKKLNCIFSRTVEHSWSFWSHFIRFIV